MADQVIGVTIKGIGDFSDVVSNVGSVQKALTKLKLPDKLGDNLNKHISNFYKEYEKYQKKIAEGIHTQGDQNAVNKSLNSMLNSYEKIINEFGKLSKKDFKDIFNLDDSAFASVQKRIKEIQAEIKKIKIDPKQLSAPMDEIEKMTKAKAVSGGGKGLDKIRMGIDANDIFLMKEGLQELMSYYDRFASKMGEQKRIAMAEEIERLKTPIENAISASDRLEQEAKELDKQFENIGSGATRELNDTIDALDRTRVGAGKVVDELKQIHEQEFSFNRQASDISRQIQSYFGLTQIIRKVGDIAKDAFATVKELDKAMTETAVVTNFSVGDMWEMLPTYTQQANQLGSTIRDVYEAATLYYQQGLNTNQAMSLANETLKMARIAGLDAADATNMMTAALRGFNMEINQTSAQKINDVYSELAAITASDTREIGSAMERTASIANSANMQFETTSAFLAQMIETTREAPENLGTAMKTIVARFQEMKKDPTKLVDSEGVAMDANKVDTALKSIGVQLMNTKGEFRDLDEVFLDIAAKWDSLTQGQQRYIATIAAGSRQQSRFIAMMSNYERTMELVDAANNSAGASQRQFEKTLDSMEAKLNMLKNAWDQFTMGLMNNQILKFGVDALTEGFTIINKFIDILGKLPPKPFEGVTKSLLTLISTIGLLKLGGRGASAISGGVLGWLGGDGFTKGFNAGWSRPGKKEQSNTTQAKQKALEDATAYKTAIKAELNKNGLGAAIKQAWQSAGKIEFTNTFDAAFGQFNGARFAASWSNDIELEITRILNSVVDDAAEIGELTGQQFKTGLINQLKNGEIGGAELKDAIQKATKKDIGSMGVNPKEISQLSNASTQLSTKLTSAGSALRDFGQLLQNTPLAPFGSLLQTIGFGLTSFGNTLSNLSASLIQATASQLGLNTELEITSWQALKAQAAEAGLTVTTGTLAGAVWALLWPFLAVAAVLGTIYGAYKLLDAAIVTNKEKLEAATDAAASAADAYDSAKQETSELNDAISKIQETDSAFDNLVAGTAEFNDQLVTANEQIMALIDKYPMLMDADKKYVKTDSNGLMHITQEGFDAIKEYQKQIQANASAMNLIQTADLNALENQQKADALRKKINGSRRGEMTEAEAQEHAKNLRDADMLEQRAKAEVQLARSNAIRTALADEEIRDVDSLTSVYTNLYDTKRKAAEVEVNGMNKHDIRQQYADYHGYTYDRSTKKITDIEGNEVDYDDKVIKDEVIEQTVLLDFEANASTLNAVLSDVDAKFASTLESTSESSRHFISDVLANNIETDEDLLEKALSGTDFQDVVNSMTEKEMAAILGINAESINETNINAKRDEIVDLLTANATNIAEAQSESYANLATMLSQSKGWDVATAEMQASQDTIATEIRNLTAEQAHMMSNIGTQLQEGAGIETMQNYISHMSELYKKINEEGLETDKQAAKEIEDIFNSVDITSAAGRLEAYTKLAQSANEDTRRWGESMRSSAEEANLLGKAFDEFAGGDWLELAEHADDFKNSLGQIDAAGIMKASEESHTLKTLLDSGEVSASGMAMALQGIEDGKYSIGAVNDSVLKLLSSLNKLEEEAIKAHNLIENFDAGIDYGEGEDFVKENAEKAKEYYDNGEWGNQQLQNYIKLAAGEERWNEAIKARHGDLQAAEQDLIKYVTTFSEGFQPAWDQMIAGQGINGKSLVSNIDSSDISNELKEKFKQVSTYWDDEGYMHVNFGELTTEELELYYEKAYGVSKEYAQLLMQDLANYDGTVSAMLAKNDLMKAVGTNEFKASHGTTETGQTILTNQEIQILRDAGGEEALEKVAEELGYAATEQKTAAQVMADASFKVLDENGNRIDNTNDPSLLQSYIKTFGMAEKGSIESLFKTGAKELFTEGVLDLSKLIQDTQARGFDQQQAMQAAWQAYQRGEQLGERTSYQGVELDKGIATYEEFTASIESALEASKWQSIGEAIAQGIINFIDGKDPGEQKDSGVTGSERDAASAQTSREIQADLANKQADAIVGFFNKIGNALSNTGTSERAQKGQEQKLYGGTVQPATQQTDTSKLDASGDKLTGAGDSLTDAANQFITGINSLSTAGENLNTAAANLTSAASAISASSKIGSTPKELKGSGGSGGSSQPQKATMSVSTGPVDTKSVNAAKTKIAADEAKLPVKTKDETASGLKAIKNKIKGTTAKINVDVSTSGTHSLSFKVVPAAKGMNNKIPSYSFPAFGSAAKGRYGTIGPKDKGGLTLTGEEGYEIAWLPSENRSMILGIGGPQMLNLPPDAVIYTHEQSEDILKRKTIDAGSHNAKTGRHKGKTSSKSKKKSKKKGKNKKSSNKDTTPTINNWSIEEAVRYNIDQSLASITEEISLRTKEIEKNLEKIGTTYNDIVGSTQAQVAALEQVKQKNQELLASNQRQLADYRAQQQYVSWTDANGESQRTLINIASYLNADGSVNTGAIQGAGGRALQEAIYKEVSSAKSIVDGINNANKAIKDADEQIAELGKKVSEAFYQWENELTEVYSLTQRINNEVSFTNRFTSQVELELSKLNTGFGDTTKSIENAKNVLTRNNATIQAQIKNQQQMIAARQRELEAALSYEDEVNKYKKLEAKTDWDSEATKTATLEWAKNLETGARLGYKYVADSIFKDIDGSIQYQIDWEKFNADNEANPYSKADYEAIKKYLDDLNSAATDFNDSIKEQTDFIKQTYDALREYQDYISDMEDTLIKGVEEEIEEAKNNAKQLSDSITGALKDLLDEVKRKLDERRKQEDNAKTERDISQKQQRLAALRADTAGGHQVEIAQLEKEIADSQQSYQRTLEDQLLDKLQQQADAAAQQRERQIELAEVGNQIAAANNKELVDMWLRDPVTYKEQIRNAWLEANGYDEKGEAGQYVLESQFESDFAQLVTAVEQTNFTDHFNELTADTNSLLYTLEQLTNGQLGRYDELSQGQNKNNALLDATERNTTSILTEMQKQNSAAMLKDKGADAATLKTLGYSAKDMLEGGYELAELQKVGYTATELKEGGINDVGALKSVGYSAKDLKDAGFDIGEIIINYGADEAKKAGFNINDFDVGNIDYNTAKSVFDLNSLAGSGTRYADIAQGELDVIAAAEAERQRQAAAAAEAERQRQAAAQAAWNAAHPYGLISSYSGTIDSGDKGNKVKAVQNALNRIIGAGLAVDGSFGSKTKNAVKKFQKATGISADGKVGNKTKGKFAAYGYKTGGLADYTGPAWLDGTPSKPELVLNPTDTKNFLALRDVLSSAMKSTGSVNNSYGGDATYEININVDHLNNDYDVDKVAERVKKIIVKDSSYRNVTQVRNLR